MQQNKKTEIPAENSTEINNSPETAISTADMISASTKQYRENLTNIQALMEAGRDDKQIAKFLGLHDSTVRRHMATIRARDLRDSKTLKLAYKGLLAQLRKGNMQAIKLVYDRAQERMSGSYLAGKTDIKITLDIGHLKGSSVKQITSADSYDDRAVIDVDVPTEKGAAR